MARRHRIQYAGAVYHVTSRGNRRETIFVDDVDRRRFLDILSDALEHFDARVFAYCLLGNHFHLVLRTDEANISALMRQVNGVYAQSFNRRHGLVGHVFQGRFDAVLIQPESYLLALCRYVELNPVHAGLAERPADWGWSTYRVHAGLDAWAPAWLDVDMVRGLMLGHEACDEDARRRAAARYAELVATPRNDAPWRQQVRRGLFLGDDAFVAKASRWLPTPRLTPPASRASTRVQGRSGRPNAGAAPP